MKKILITGISGFIGGHVWKLYADTTEVYGTFGSRGCLPYYPEKQYRIDLNYLDSLYDLVKKIRPSCILHLAALSSPAQCQINSDQAWMINYHTIKRLTELKQLPEIRIIYASSDQVFQGSKGMYVEDDLPNPVNIYGETKYAAEKILKENCDNLVIARINNTYGPPRFNNGSSFSQWIINQCKEQNRIPLFTDQFRSPIDVITLGKALVELTTSDFQGTIHLGGPQRLSRYEFGILLMEKLGLDKTLIDQTRSKDIDLTGTMPFDTSYNISLAKKTLSTRIFDAEKGIEILYKQ